MPLLVARDPETRRRDALPDALEIGLVNNMPDKALEATERQFTALLGAAAGDIPVRLWLYSLPLVPRGERGAQHLDGSYLGLRDFWDSRLDALIVTGTEPRAPALANEPYWPALAELIEWAERHTISTVWSCLAAHAAVYQLDGIMRHPLPDKRFGVFDCVSAADHPLTAGLASRFRVPHSRWNELREDEIVARGYEILTRSAEAGVDTFARQNASLFVFFQGHPEYEPSSLLGEYRRDLGRFLRRERETCPAVPHNYFDAATVARLCDLQARALMDRREELLAEFPQATAEAGLRNGWRDGAIQIYRNWLGLVSTLKGLGAGRRTIATVTRPRRPDAPRPAAELTSESYIDRRSRDARPRGARCERRTP